MPPFYLFSTMSQDNVHEFSRILRGNSTQNIVRPFPLSHQIRPPCAWTICLHTDKPNPGCLLPALLLTKGRRGNRQFRERCRGRRPPRRCVPSRRLARIADNIRYNFEGYKKGDLGDNSWAGAIKTGILLCAGYAGKIVEQGSLVLRTANKATVLVKFPKPGRYQVVLFGKKTGMKPDRYEALVSIPLEYSGIVSVIPVFPLFYQPYSDLGCRLESPLPGILEKGKEFKLIVKLPGVVAALLPGFEEACIFENQSQ